MTLAAAESCTGGLLAAALVGCPGASRIFLGAVVAYANAVKESILGVQPQTLNQWGAVSAQTAMEMAKGAAMKTGASIGVSTTGIAGPGGGSPEKPVGLVYVAFWLRNADGGRTLCLRLAGSRNKIRQKPPQRRLLAFILSFLTPNLKLVK